MTNMSFVGTSTLVNVDDIIIPNDPDGFQRLLHDNDISLQWLLDHHNVPEQILRPHGVHLLKSALQGMLILNKTQKESFGVTPCKKHYPHDTNKTSVYLASKG